jgi:hypothetical protein
LIGSLLLAATLNTSQPFATLTPFERAALIRAFLAATITKRGGGTSFIDSTFQITDDVDPTKIGKFDLSAITTGNTRTLVWPNANGTMCISGANCTFTTQQTFTAGAIFSTSGVVRADSSIPIGWGSSQQFDSQYTAAIDSWFLRSGSGGPYRLLFRNSPKTLTEASATAVVRFNISNALTSQFSSLIHYTVRCSDATDTLVGTGLLSVRAVNKASTETCVVSEVQAFVTSSSSGATLTSAGFTCDTTPVDGVDITFNVTCSLTQTTLDATYSIWQDTQQATITPQ